MTFRFVPPHEDRLDAIAGHGRRAGVPVTVDDLRRDFGLPPRTAVEPAKGYGDEWHFTDGRDLFAVYSRHGMFRVGAKPDADVDGLKAWLRPFSTVCDCTDHESGTGRPDPACDECHGRGRIAQGEAA